MVLLRVGSDLAFWTGNGTARRGRPSECATVRVRRVREERRREEVRGERRALHAVLLQGERVKRGRVNHGGTVEQQKADRVRTSSPPA
jgi:hypothetical protein